MMKNNTLDNKKNILLELEKKAEISVNRESKTLAFTFFKILFTVLFLSFIAYIVSQFFKKKKKKKDTVDAPAFHYTPPIVNSFLEKLLNRFFSLVFNIVVDIVLIKIQKYLKNGREK